MIKFFRRLLRRDTVPVVEPAPMPSASTEERAPVVTAEEAKRQCTHRPVQGPFKIKILGATRAFTCPEICPSCLEAYLSKVSTLCAGCNGPILPGTPVAAAWIGAEHPYTHVNHECGEPAFYCGMWGEGQLMGLKDLYDSVNMGGIICLKPKVA